MGKVVADAALKRPQSAYFLWLNANRAKIEAAAGTKKGPEVSKKAAEMWKAVSAAEKAPFEEQSKRDKEKYDAYVKTEEGQKGLQALKEERKEAKVADVKRAQKIAARSVEKDENLKKPQSAYWLWLGANRERIAKAAGSSNGPAVGKKAGEMWKVLSDAEKKPFEEQAKAAKEKYDAYVKSDEGAAALKAFKAAQADAKAEVKGAEPAAKKLKVAEAGA